MDIIVIAYNKGKIRGTTAKINVLSLIKKAQKKAKGTPQRGRPSKEEKRDEFAWSDALTIRGGKVKGTTAAITGQSIVAALIKKPLMQPITTTAGPTILGPEVTPEYIAEQKKRERWIRGRRAEAEEYLKDGALMPSSWVDELIYDDETQKVFATFNATEKYTFFNVPEIIFNAWYAGQATCITDDRGAFRRKRWIQGKTPSLGAFFNKSIKNKYQYTRGWVE